MRSNILQLCTTEEVNEAEVYWIKAIQDEFFRTEIKYLSSDKTVGGPIYVKQCGLFLDQGILKCCGRLNNSTLSLGSKNPISLPHDHPFVELLILQYHQNQKSKYSGVNDILTLLCENYWILRGNHTVTISLKMFVMCLKCEGLPF